MQTDRPQILIVDDSPVNISLLGAILKDDYEISVANSALNALEFLKKFKPDLLLLDIMMPGMDGFQLARELQQNESTADIPIMFVTAKADEQTEVEGLQLGAIDFISKPISNAVVKLRVKNFLLLLQQQQQIRHNQLLMQSVFETISDAVIVYDQFDRITSMNPQVSKFWPEVTVSENSGMNIGIGDFLDRYILAELDETHHDRDSVRSMITTKIIQKGNIQLTRARYFSFYTAPLYNGQQWLGSVLSFTNVSEQIRLQQRLHNIAITDELTGLFNRRYFNETIKRELAACQRHSTTLSLMILDIDFFKKINDRLGHSMGDRVLSQIAKTIQNSVRKIDFCFRYGGEEFIVLLPNTNKKGIADTAIRIMRNIEAIRQEDLTLSVSIGAATSTLLEEHQTKPMHDQLLDLADQQLYRAKQEGRRRMYLQGCDKMFTSGSRF